MTAPLSFAGAALLWLMPSPADARGSRLLEPAAAKHASVRGKLFNIH